MANAIQDALNRASQSPEFKQAQETFRNHNITLAINSGTSSKGDLSSSSSMEQALNRASQGPQYKDAQETLRNNNVSMTEPPEKLIPQNTPSQTPANTKQSTLDPQTQSNIESIQQGQGNNYLYQNAIDRAQARTPQQSQKATPEQDKER